MPLRLFRHLLLGLLLASPALAQMNFPRTYIYVERLNIAAGNGRYVPALQISTGTHFEYIRAGELGLTVAILHNLDALRAWVIAYAGQSPDIVVVFPDPPTESADPIAAPSGPIDPGETPVICDPSHQDCPVDPSPPDNP